MSKPRHPVERMMKLLREEENWTKFTEKYPHMHHGTQYCLIGALKHTAPQLTDRFAETADLLFNIIESRFDERLYDESGVEDHGPLPDDYEDGDDLPEDEWNAAEMIVRFNDHPDTSFADVQEVLFAALSLLVRCANAGDSIGDEYDLPLLEEIYLR